MSPMTGSTAGAARAIASLDRRLVATGKEVIGAGTPICWDRRAALVDPLSRSPGPDDTRSARRRTLRDH
jgi:hypothetical protein